MQYQNGRISFHQTFSIDARWGPLYNVSNWREAYEREGPKGLKSKTRGFDTGQWRTLDASQEGEIQGLIVEKTLDQLKLVFALWPRNLVRELIWRQRNVPLSFPSGGRLLTQLVLSCQNPLARALERKPVLGIWWVAEYHPCILLSG